MNQANRLDDPVGRPFVEAPRQGVPYRLRGNADDEQGNAGKHRGNQPMNQAKQPKKSFHHPCWQGQRCSVKLIFLAWSDQPRYFSSLQESSPLFRPAQHGCVRLAGTQKLARPENPQAAASHSRGIAFAAAAALGKCVTPDVKTTVQSPTGDPDEPPDCARRGRGLP